MNDPEKKRFEKHVQDFTAYYETLEPVHIGAGGNRLGRVDKTICREPGTNLPKIPGTSLSGAARSYAAMLYGEPLAAGAAKWDGRPSPIFYTFGHAAEGSGDGGNAGTVSFGDARILLFPVASILGRVWVTTAALISKWNPGMSAGIDQIRVSKGLANGTPGVNLGWLWFDGAERLKVADTAVELNEHLTKYRDRTIVVPENLFAPIVNSNLEVRTSVAINPTTGTASKGLLFSCEAIPRETVLFQKIVIDDYRKDNTKPDSIEPPWIEAWEKLQWHGPLDVVKVGLEMMATLGVGGMGTRGFGRLELIKLGLTQ